MGDVITLKMFHPVLWPSQSRLFHPPLFLKLLTMKSSPSFLTRNHQFDTNMCATGLVVSGFLIGSQVMRLPPRPHLSALQLDSSPVVVTAASSSSAKMLVMDSSSNTT